MHRGVTAAAAVGAVLVVGALLVESPVAQAQAGPRGAMHQTMVGRAAAILGVTPARLTDALAQAHDDALYNAVKSGQLTQEQADWMKQHHRAIQQGAGPGMMGGMMGPGMMGSGVMRGGPGARPDR